MAQKALEAKMAEPKTKKTDASVEAFLERTTEGERRSDCLAVLKMMKQVARAEPKMWGTAIVGFGAYHYKYSSGREGDAPVIAFSPRKQSLTLYVLHDTPRFEALLEGLGPFKRGGGCLHLKRLGDIDLKALKALLVESVRHMKATHPTTF